MKYMRTRIFAIFAAALFLVGMTGCSSVDNPSTEVDTKVLEESLVGLWVDEFEYADVTEAGVPFSKVVLAVDVAADHTGCLYLGVFDNSSDEPLAVYGGPEDAAFTWRLLADGSVELSDPVTGKTRTLTRGADGSYGEQMTEVASTKVTVTDGGMQLTNGNYSGNLTKADAAKAAQIKEKLSSLSPDRQQFEAQLSQMLAASQNYLKLDPTSRGVNLLAEFISQLKLETLQPQLVKIIFEILGTKGFTQNLSLVGPEAEEARWAQENSNVPVDNPQSAFLMNAALALNNRTLKFTTGQDAAEYVTNEDGAFIVSCKNATSGALTQVKMRFSGKDDGVIIFVTRLNQNPVAIQFPHAIDFELLRSESGNETDIESVIKGHLTLESSEGKKYISLKRSAWRATLFTEAKKDDHFEVPSCELIHHADHTIEVSSSLAINDVVVMTVKGRNELNPYSDEEMEQLRELRDITPMCKGLYTLLKAFNSRTAKAEVTVMNDLLFDIDLLDVAQCIKAAGNALKLRKENVPAETIEPWTELLNKSLNWTVTQKATGVKADGKFITSLFAGHNLPTFALRFNGESNFQTIHGRMNTTDRQNFEALMKSFDAPLVALNGLLKALQDKGVELQAINSSK